MEQATLSIKNLRKAYKGQLALDNVSLEAFEGDIVGLLGHNGAGKSTLIKCVMGAIQSYTGQIEVLGHDARHDRDTIAKRCGFLLEPAFSGFLTAQENLYELAILCGTPKAKADELLDLVSLKKAAKKKVSQFSFGMKQRLGLAQALLTDPDMIILDEPTVGLDPFGIKLLKEMLANLAKQGKTVLFSSHQLKDVEDVCNKVVVLDHGHKTRESLMGELTTQKVVTVHTNGNNKFAMSLIGRIDPNAEVTEQYIRFSNIEKTSEILSTLIHNQIEILDIDAEQEDRLQSLLFEKKVV